MTELLDKWQIVRYELLNALAMNFVHLSWAEGPQRLVTPLLRSHPKQSGDNQSPTKSEN